MKAILSLLLVACSLLLLTQCHPLKEQHTTTPPIQQVKPRNVILLIGDGMGLSQITAGLYSNHNRLQIERFKQIGFHKSYSSDDLVTDSAAGATAFSCGKKTYNGAIAVDPDTIPCKTLLEEAEDHGLATGLVATSTIVHATPASFIAHNPYRRNYEAIAGDFPGSGIDYFVGGGLKFFQNREKDDRNICEELRKEGYLIQDYFTNDINRIQPDPKRPFGFLTANEDPLTAENGRDYLLPAAQAGLTFLKQRSSKGFFMMIEGSQIDWGGHANNSQYIITEMLDFDKVIGNALDFAQANPGTLVILTADHETGGYSIIEGSRMDSLVTAFTTKGHSASLIPVFAFGPGAEQFQGIYENTAIYDKIMALMGW
ncbi:MAG: alkaline phosphatase [Saprospiraceae bacterium]